MFLKIAFWRAPGSILEAPGLDFGGSRIDFFKIFACFWPFGPRTCQELVESHDACLERCSSEAVRSVEGRDLTKWVGGGVPPGGSSIRRPPQVVLGVLDIRQIVLS